MASRELMEARCGSCHRERQPRGTQWLARGRALVADRNCAACHELPGYDAAEVRAPRLDGLALKVTPGWLRAWLTQPRAYYPKTRMGEFRLSERDVEALTAFLLGQPQRAPLDPVDWSQADTEKGGEIFRRSRCVTCHSLNGRGGTLAPELAHVGSKVSRDWLYTWIRDPHRLQPKTLMPRFRFADDELRDLAAYLASEYSDPPRGFAGREGAPDAALAAEGRRVFEKRGCYSCHDLEGFPKLARIGPKLSAIGDRVLEPAPLVARGVRATLPNWLFTKVRTPDAVLEGARMPTFGFSEEDGAALAVALMSLRAREMPASRTTQRPRAAAVRAAGRVRRAREALPLPVVPLDRRQRRHAVDGGARPHRLAAHARAPGALHPEALRDPREPAGAHAPPQRRAGGGAAARRLPLARDGRRLARGGRAGGRGDGGAGAAAVRGAGLRRLPHRRREGRLRRARS